MCWFRSSQFWKIDLRFESMCGCGLQGRSQWRPRKFDPTSGRSISGGVGDSTRLYMGLLTWFLHCQGRVRMRIWLHHLTRTSVAIQTTSAEFPCDVFKIVLMWCKDLYTAMGWFRWSQILKIDFQFDGMVGCGSRRRSHWCCRNFDPTSGRLILGGVSDSTRL